MNRLTTMSLITGKPILNALAESCGESACNECCEDYCEKECEGCPVQDGVTKLHQYEDTGRDPGEISALDYDVAMLKQSARHANELYIENGQLKEQIKRLETSLSHYE